MSTYFLFFRLLVLNVFLSSMMVQALDEKKDKKTINFNFIRQLNSTSKFGIVGLSGIALFAILYALQQSNNQDISNPVEEDLSNIPKTNDTLTKIILIKNEKEQEIKYVVAYPNIIKLLDPSKQFFTQQVIPCSRYNNIPIKREINLPLIKYFDLYEWMCQQYEKEKILYEKYQNLNKDKLDIHTQPDEKILSDQEITKVKKIEQKQKIIKYHSLPKQPVVSYRVKPSFESHSINKSPEGEDAFIEKADDALSVEKALNESYRQLKFDYVLSTDEARKELIIRFKKDFLEFFTNAKTLLTEEQLKTNLIENNMIPEFIYGGVLKNQQIILCDYSESILYYIFKNNLTSFIDILLQAKNVYEIISLYDDQLHNFYTAIQDIRVLSLLYHKRNFDEERQNKSPIRETITSTGTIWLYYPRMTYFNEYLRDFIVSLSKENLEKIFNTENNIFQVLKNCIPGKKRKIWLTRDCLWRQLYFANEERIEKNKSIQENPLTTYCVHYISYIYDTSIHELAKQRTSLTSYLLQVIGKTEYLPYVNKKDVIYSYSLESLMECLPRLEKNSPIVVNAARERSYCLNHILANTGWSNIETASPEDNNYE